MSLVSVPHVPMIDLTKKTVLVTGGTGLVGSHLVKALCERGSEVIVIQRERNPRSFFETEKLDQKAVVVSGDIRDRDRMEEILSTHEVNVIFHLAAQALVPQAFFQPARTFETNVMGTVNILEAARTHGKIESVVVASTDKAYGKTEGVVRESDPLKGNHPYEASKSAADLIASTYAITYDMPVTITRFGNIYGEGDLNFNRLIPGLMKAMISGEPFEIRSDGTFTRDYVHVKDVVEGYILLAENIEKVRGEAFNLTSHQNLSVLEVIELAKKVLNKKVETKILNSAQNEIPHQRLDDSKLREKLGWASRYTLESTIVPIHEWYEKIFV